MKRAGWNPGDVYCPMAKTHDGLVDFDDLPAIDRRAAALRMEADGIVPRLSQLAAPDRSATRPFGTSELKAGIQVGWAGEGSSPAEPGTIESWDIDEETGDVALIHVRWQDGSLESFGTFEGLLRRL